MKHSITMTHLKLFKVTSIFFMSAMGVLLSGCDTIRSTLGLDHYQADAFNTPTNPPLTLPPDYNLRPPAPGAAPTNVQAADTKAKETLQVAQGQVYTGNSSEQRLVSQLPSTTMAPENIRELVDREAEEENTLAGKMGKQAKSWKKQAKENFYSLSGDASKDPSGDKMDEKNDDKDGKNKGDEETEVDKLKKRQGV